MSYDIYLCYPDGTLADVPRHIEGGTYTVGGTTEAHANITYNYTEYYSVIDGKEGIRWLYGKTGRKTVRRLLDAILEIGCEVDDNYWKATPGNAGAALIPLLLWAILHPDAVWEGD